MTLPRIRQLVLANQNLAEMETLISKVFSVEVGFRDDLSVFGLENIVVPFGDTFLEVVSPIVALDKCTAGRLIQKVGGDCGYMVIVQTQDHKSWAQHAEQQQFRKIWEIERTDKGITVQATHLHPVDTGAAILSVDQMSPQSAWLWCGDSWESKVDQSLVEKLIGCVIACDSPADISDRWSRALNAPALKQQDAQDETYSIQLGDTTMKFVPWSQAHAGITVKAKALPVEFQVKCNDAEQIISNAKQNKLEVRENEILLGNVKFSLH